MVSSVKTLQNIIRVALWMIAISVASGPVRAEAAQLVMLEQAGCEWCRVWNEEVGVAYPKTEEGAFAPLRRIDIHKPLPEDIATLAKGRFTPTFVVWQEGREIGRIQGYPGAHFFWPMLQEILKKAEPAFKATANAEPKS